MPIRLRVISLASAGAAVLAGPLSSRAQNYPAGFTATELASTGLANPTGMARAPDGRIYIAQQQGTVMVWDPASGLIATPFDTFPVHFSGERGLIGIAVDPNWSTNHYIYVHYSRALPANGPIIRRITADAANPNIPVAVSETTLLDLGNYPSTNDWHVGGGMRFGPDGKLYVALGENGISANSQTIANIFGKLLRINPDPASPIPTDNPTTFAGITGSPTGANRIIWAAGLRNPFTFAFHPLSGRLFINDVGQDAWEEIDDGVAGLNYGWPDTEGDFVQSSFPNYTRPFYTYSHTIGTVTGEAILGATFYNPPEHAFPPDYVGDYFFGDLLIGWVKRIDTTTKAVTDFADGLVNIVGLDADPQGRLLILTNDGPPRLIRVDYTATLAPTILTSPTPILVGTGGTARFSVYAAGNRTLTYQWRRNTVPLFNGGQVSGATGATLTITGVTCQNAASYDCVVSNAAGQATSNAAPLVGPTPCYVNCDCSTAAPKFNVADFTCFIQKFTAGDPYANCDASTVPPVLNIYDFICFVQKAAAGCP